MLIITRAAGYIKGGGVCAKRLVSENDRVVAPRQCCSHFALGTQVLKAIIHRIGNHITQLNELSIEILRLIGGLICPVCKYMVTSTRTCGYA